MGQKKIKYRLDYKGELYMGHICEICGRSNNRTKYQEKFELILCDSCLRMCKKYKFYYIPPKGEIHYDNEGNIICHCCGRSFKKLSEHIKTKHHMSKDRYKEEFGLNRTAKLTGTNFPMPTIVSDITEISKAYRFKQGHKKSNKSKRLQTIKNRTGLKYNTKKCILNSGKENDR